MALGRIPTLFGRLVYLASLRNLTTGHYAHQGLAEQFGPDETERVIHQTHRRIFHEWLNYNLSDQKAELDEHWGAGTGPFLMAELRELPPRSAREVEKQLFLTDLETLLELWKAERSAFPAPEA